MSSVAGLREWIVQRLTAIYMAFYLVFLVGYITFHPAFSFDSWKGFSHLVWIETANMLFLVCMLWHAWIGIWTVITDYLKQPAIRMIVQALVILVLVACLVWGAEIIWGMPIYWSLA